MHSSLYTIFIIDYQISVLNVLITDLHRSLPQEKEDRVGKLVIIYYSHNIFIS